MKKLLMLIFIIFITSCKDPSTDNATVVGTTPPIVDTNPKINSLSYVKKDFILPYQVILLSPYYPTYYGSIATSFSIFPNLPAGLNFSTLSGRIAGTPEELVLTPKTYTITATNSYGSASYDITIKIVKQAPFGLRYNVDRVDMLTNSSDLSIFPESSPGVRGGATIDSYSISPSLPTGIVFNTTTGAIEGKPTISFADRTYTVIGTNSGGSISTSLIMSSKPLVGQIIAGGKHTCAMIDSKLHCWGDNKYGQLGLNNSQTSLLVPTIVPFIFDRISQLTLGSENTCITQADSKLYCWGRNKNNQFGELIESQYNVPTFVTDLIINGSLSKHGYEKIGSLGHSCSVSNGGFAQCFGEFTFGNLSGVNYYFKKSSDSSNLSNITMIRSGNDFVCALDNVGAVYCLGDNTYGQLGNGTYTLSTMGVTPIGLESGVFQIDSGSSYACALKTDGSVWCWGDNTYGKLGKNSLVATQSNIPVKVEGLFSDIASKLVLGSQHACAISNNIPYCWGDNTYGQLGNSSNTSSSIPVIAKINGSIDFSAISYLTAGEGHTCAQSLNTLYCWGLNDKGQLGITNTNNTNFPVAVTPP